MDRYAEMTVNELHDERSRWSKVVDAPKGPGTPSNSAREAATRHIDEIDGWLALIDIECKE